MKKILLVSAAFISSLSLWGCNEEIEYRDIIYFTGTETTNERTMYIDGPATYNITVTSSKQMEEDVTVYVEMDPTLIDRLNAETGGTYQLLPAGSYNVHGDHVTISAGSSVSSAIVLELLSVNDFVNGEVYCIPFKITGNSAGIDVLDSQNYVYIHVTPVVSTRGVNLNWQWFIFMDDMANDPDLADLPACTLEIRVFINGWGRANHLISTLIGVEENFLLRYGDISLGNGQQIQLAGRDPSITAPTWLQLGQWYHIAVVDNGSEATIYINGEPDVTASTATLRAINLGFYYNSPFAIGHSANDSERFLHGYASEARAWRRALTQVELKNNMCSLDVDAAEGLIGYWRLDQVMDGTTNRFQNLAADKYHGIAKSGYRTPTEYHNILFTDVFTCPVIE